MTDPVATESGLPEQPSRFERGYRAIRSYWWLLVAALVAVAAVLEYLGAMPDIGRDAQLVATVAVPTALGATVVFDRVVSGRQQFRVLLVQVGIEDGDAGAWWLSKLGVRELETEQQLYKPVPTLWFAREYDPAEHRAVGTWRGTLSDAELLRGLNTVADLRGDLEDQARRGFLIESNLPSVVNKATRKTARSIIKFFAGEQLPDRGDGLDEAVQDVLGELDANATWDDLDGAEDLPDHMDTSHIDPTAEPPADENSADLDASLNGDTDD